jgi:acyl carrier protein
MLEKVKSIIAEHLSVEGIEITPETSFKDDLGADSLDLFELIMAFEEEYGIEIPPEDLEGVATVADVMAMIASRAQ